MEQTPKGAARSDERGRPEVVVPCQVGVAGPEADPAHSVSEAPDRLWGADMEQTPKAAARSDERGRPEVVVPCQVGVAGPEADPAHSVSEAPDRLWGADMAPSPTPGRTRSRLALLAFAAVAMTGCVESETSAKAQPAVHPRLRRRRPRIRQGRPGRRFLLPPGSWPPPALPQRVVVPDRGRRGDGRARVRRPVHLVPARHRAASARTACVHRRRGMAHGAGIHGPRCHLGRRPNAATWSRNALAGGTRAWPAPAPSHSASASRTGN